MQHDRQDAAVEDCSPQGSGRSTPSLARSTTSTRRLARTRLVVEGWRGINHSIAMVNQNQLLAWRVVPGMQLFHVDAPFFVPAWNTAQHGAGFEDADTAWLGGLPAPDGGPVDAVFRIHSPILPPPLAQATDAPRRLSYVITEFGLSGKSFGGAAIDPLDFTRGDDRVVTATAWSRDRLLDHGFDDRHVHVVPHGVRLETFHPSPTAQRRAERAALGLHDDHFVFANVGVATWNKGIDQLLIAFARVRQRHAGARLLLKDHRSLYGLSAETVFQSVAKSHPGLLSSEVLASISLITHNLNQAQLRALYACADCYVSPYRAEGFNLPVLEALACGTPVVVTAGGATDDFCSGPWATRVRGRAGTMPDAQVPGGRYIEIDADGLVDAMEQRLQAAEPDRRLGGTAWERFRLAMAWDRVSLDVLALCLGDPPQAVQPTVEAEDAQSQKLAA